MLATIVTGLVMYLVFTVLCGVLFIRYWGDSMGEPEWVLAAAYGLLWPLTGLLLALGWAVRRVNSLWGLRL